MNKIHVIFTSENNITEIFSGFLKITFQLFCLYTSVESIILEISNYQMIHIQIELVTAH